MYDALRPGIVEESPKRVGPDSYRGWGDGLGTDSPAPFRGAAQDFCKPEVYKLF